jgi:glycosyltransferase involved in cell wall biosynthesis
MSATPVHDVSSTALTPGPGLDSQSADTFAVRAPHVRLIAEAPLEPGWYEIRLATASADRFTIRKRIELTFDAADDNPRPAAREAFAWNRTFAERFMLRLTRPAAVVRLDVWHAEGTLTLNEFRVRRVSRPLTVARAVLQKVRLVRAYRCFGSALLRGVRLLARGKFAEFGTKMLKGLTDARAMQLGAIHAGEADAAWWRRNALPAEQAELIRQAVGSLADPPPLAVLLPVDPARLDAARLSVHSVRRQLYPHWHLLLAVAGPSDMAKDLERLLGTDPRVSITRVPLWAGLSAAIARAVGQTECDRVLVLPPGVELAEHALYHLAAAVKTNPDGELVGGKVAQGLSAGPGTEEPAAVWLTRACRIGDGVPKDLGPQALANWVTGGKSDGTILDPVLAYPIDDRPLLDRARVGKAPVIQGKTLFLAADLRGIGGYDHVAFALLRGLPSAGAELRLHHHAGVRADLIPPALLPPHATRKAGNAQLVMGPPFLVPRFGLDRASAVFTMWETDRFDPHWVNLINRAGLVIVPSRWQAECFRVDGITPPIAVAPLGFDPLVYHPSGEFPKVCTFGTAGALTAGGVRKNAQWVIDLFRRAFPDVLDVRLRVKITPGSPGVETYDDPRVDVLRAVLPHGELADWYRSLTAYVNGSFGEGFGLHLIEAMACGRPILSPCHSGLTAFFDPSVGYAVDFKLVPARNEIYRGTWAEPDEESMIERMRQVYADRNEAMRLGAASAARAKNFTWKAAGQQLVKALREHGFLQ